MAGLSVMTNQDLVKRYLRRERQDFDVWTGVSPAGNQWRSTRDPERAVRILEHSGGSEFTISFDRGNQVTLVVSREQLRSLVDQAEVLEV